MKRNSGLIFVVVAMLLGVSLCLTMSSCDNEYGLLASIQTETKQQGNNVFKAVNNVVSDGVHFYAVTTKIWYRPVAGPASAWQELSIHGSTDYSMAMLAASADESGKLWAADIDANSLALNGLWASSNSGSSWTAVPDPALASGETIQGLFRVHGVLYASSMTGSAASTTYGLWTYSDGGATWTNTLSGLSHPITAIVWDGSAYWFAGGPTLYTGAAGATPAAVTTVPVAAASHETFIGLAIDDVDGTSLYVLCASGNGYRYAGGAWSPAALSVAGGLAAPALASARTSAAASRLLVGVKYGNNGYVEYDWVGQKLYKPTTGALVPTESSYSSTIYNKTVRGLFYDRNCPKLTIFASVSTAAASYGLYSNTWNGSTWSGWTAE